MQFDDSATLSISQEQLQGTIIMKCNKGTIRVANWEVSALCAGVDGS